MDKTVYFESLLKRDFMRYILLRDPFLTENDCVARLMNVIDVSDFMGRMKLDIKDVCHRHMYDMHADEAPDVPAVRPAPWLRPGIVNDIAADYARQLDEILAPGRFEARVIACVERLTWLQGIGSMAAAIRRFSDKAADMAAGYEAIPVTGRDRDALAGKYEAAMRVTVAEHITGGNRNDIADYMSELGEYARAECEEVLYRKVAAMYRGMARSQALGDIAARFESMHSELEAQRQAMDAPGRQPDLDAEYSRLVPVDFYERNVENINGVMAFQMVLLQAFARHEAELRADGFLNADGELRIFTNPAFTPRHWVEQNISRILG